MFNKTDKTKVHFIGIGGIGMSGIAHVLLQLGYKVSGSDGRASSITDSLKALGADIFIGHQQQHVSDATVVVYSSAIKEDNPERQEAKKRGIPQIQRAEMLSELMRLKYGIAVAGSHGKTTTTSILATILHESQLDPTHIIGGVVANLGNHAQVGKGEILVAEADESDGSFLLLNPIMCVITNIDNDHLDFYQNQNRLVDAFEKFANSVPFYGCCSLNMHDPLLRQLKQNLKRPYVTFAITDELTAKEKDQGLEQLDYEARNVRYQGQASVFDLYVQGSFATEIKIGLPGRHNILNALGAISLAHKMDVSFQQIAQAVEKFKGVGRRFESLYQQDHLSIVDDYAHHPTEIASTLSAARQLNPEKLIVIFEPHRYSRTEICWRDFFHCFNLADELYLLPIYAASERPLEGISSERLIQDINQLHPGLGHMMESDEGLMPLIMEKKNRPTKNKTIILTLGAGSIGKKIREVVEKLKK